MITAKKEEEYDYECIQRAINELGIPVREEEITYFLIMESCKKVGKHAKKKK